MANYFADTSFWVALVDRQDAFHAKAIEWSSKLSGGLVTTQAVLLETANAFSRPAWRENVIALLNHVVTRNDIDVVDISDARWDLAWKLFCARLDKSWSLTDCMSFEVMQEHNLTEAPAADSHFRQAGFHAILLDA